MIFRYLSILFLGLLLSACAKKHVFLNGQEGDEQAFAKCAKLSEKKHFEEAIECLEIFKSRFADSPYALDAELKIADTYFKKKEYLLAAETYQVFARFHPASPKLDYAYYRTGLSYFHESPKKIDRDQEHLPEAMNALKVVFEQYPNSPYASMAKSKYNEARRKIANRQFYIGRFYYKQGEYRAAIPRFMKVVEEYSDLGLEASSLYYAALGFDRLEKHEEARQIASALKEKFPGSKEAGKIGKILK